MARSCLGRGTRLARVLLLLAALLWTAGSARPALADQSIDAPPAVVLWDGPALVQARDDVRAGKPEIALALAELRRSATSALRAGPYAVTQKGRLAPSGDPHDYTSLSIYWWPDPAATDGLPYVNRDGQVNPETDNTDLYDRLTMGRMIRTVETLALAYYLTDELTYAEGAALLVRVWFLDEGTRMNPSMAFAQLIPGRPAPRGIGIIESRDLMRVTDAVALLAESGAWTVADQTGLQQWFRELASWLQESPQGQMEAREPNNHGVWFDAQLAGFALFAGDRELAASIVAQSPARRIGPQIEPDGRQPLELARTRPLHYSIFNLEAFARLARIGDQVGIDLWHAEAPNGASLRTAFDLAIHAATGTVPWPYPEISPVDAFRELGPSLHHAARGYADGDYARSEADLSAGKGPLPQLKLALGGFYLN